jgi:deoxyribodipyrimidine photolyase-related protein
MTTVWIFGDQLTLEHSALAGLDKKKSVILMVESKMRSGWYRYHKCKLALIFSAMRHFAKELEASGWKVDYHKLTPDFQSAVAGHIQKYKPERVRVMSPNDLRMENGARQLAAKLRFSLEVTPTTMFLVPREEFRQWAGAGKRLLMENHYRRLRVKLGILVDKQGQPEGGAWNFDARNRGEFKQFAKEKPRVPPPVRDEPDAVTQEVMELVNREFPQNPGDARDFWLPVTRAGALKWLDAFIKERLPHFGLWEDLMVSGEPMLFHSALTPMLNIGLLRPMECVDAAVSAYRRKRAPLEAVEGFVRQIIGWREFINGVYWLRMPGYTELNTLGASRKIPGWLYTGKTEMNCLSQCVVQALRTGYNHHIQRLMVLGNFFLLGGYDPQEVYRWYMEMYVDAHDWVMAANVIGMALHADGGFMATKPYAASGNYIQKMSNYCAGCRYRPEVKTGPDACPYNYLYWNFFATHEERFSRNPRVSVMTQAWRKKPDAEKRRIRREAREFLEKNSG